MEILVERNEIQIFWNEIQAEWNKFQIRRNEIKIQSPFTFFAESMIFQGVTPIRGLSFLRRLLDAPRRSRRCSFASGCSSVRFVFVSGASGVLKQVKGWHLL
jgi:hypothetical protein